MKGLEANIEPKVFSLITFNIAPPMKNFVEETISVHFVEIECPSLKPSYKDAIFEVVERPNQQPLTMADKDINRKRLTT